MVVIPLVTQISQVYREDFKKFLLENPEYYPKYARRFPSKKRTLAMYLALEAPEVLIPILELFPEVLHERDGCGRQLIHYLSFSPKADWSIFSKIPPLYFRANDYLGRRPIHYLAYRGNHIVLNAFIQDESIPLEVYDIYNRLPIFYSVFRKDLSIFRQLYDPKYLALRDSQGLSLEDLALISESKDIYEYITSPKLA